MSFTWNPVRFAGIYVAILVLVAVLGFVLAQFEIELPAAMGAISVMLAAMYEAQLTANGLTEKPARGLWRAALIMNLIAVAISGLVLLAMVASGLLDAEIFGLIDASIWVIATLAVLALGVLMTRLGIRLGLKAALAAAQKGS